LSIFERIFLPEVKPLFFGGCPKKLQPYWTSSFQIIAVFSGQKGTFLLFFVVKIGIQLSEHLRMDSIAGNKNTTFFRMLYKISAQTDKWFQNYGHF
jgi:hypothetical protein